MEAAKLIQMLGLYEHVLRNELSPHELSEAKRDAENDATNYTILPDYLRTVYLESVLLLEELSKAPPCAHDESARGLSSWDMTAHLKSMISWIDSLLQGEISEEGYRWAGFFEGMVMIVEMESNSPVDLKSSAYIGILIIRRIITRHPVNDVVNMIGIVQAMLWASGLYSLAELKEHY